MTYETWPPEHYVTETQHAFSRIATSARWNDAEYTQLLEREMALPRNSGWHAVATSSGTAALWMILSSLPIAPASTVIVPAYTFSGSVWPIIHAGHLPYFADVDPQTGLIDLDSVPDSIYTMARAIMPVYIEGQRPDLDAVFDIAARYDLFVIEDAAQGHGVVPCDPEIHGDKRYVMLSLNSTKLVPAGEGGVLLTTDSILAERFRAAGRFGERTVTDAIPGVRPYNVTDTGFNLRMSEFTAALALTALRHLPEAGYRSLINSLTLSSYLQNKAGLDGACLPRMLPGKANGHKYRLRLPDELYRHSEPASERAITTRYLLAMRGQGAPVSYWHLRPVAFEPMFTHYERAELRNATKLLNRSIIVFDEKHPLCAQHDTSIIARTGQIIEGCLQGKGKGIH